VGINPTRTGFLDVLKAMGANVSFSGEAVSGDEPLADIQVKKSTLTGTSIGGDLIPRLIDEIPILALLATQAKGETVISDAAELRVKESDRLTALHIELTNMGARVSKKPDGLVIKGPTPLSCAVVKSHGDHRLAMTLAIAALIARGGPTTIQDVACVETSFPDFWKVLDTLRAR